MNMLRRLRDDFWFDPLGASMVALSLLLSTSLLVFAILGLMGAWS